MDRAGALLEIEGLRVEFRASGGLFLRDRVVRAVDGVTVRVGEGEAVGLIGESGSGKTTIARSAVRLVRPCGGTARFDSVDVWRARGAMLQRVRREMQIVFQDAGGALSPRLRVGQIVGEPLVVHREGRRRERARRVGEAMERCGLSAALASRRPHELSGGQRQRALIARALTVRPRLLICDEPTSALDVSVQAQVLNLLRELRTAFGLAVLLVSHDMGVVNFLCDRVVVLRGGKVVEEGPRERVLAEPREEYTRSLLDASLEPAAPRTS
ncbi:MAG: ATP-binding cassette domain-containing protein [Phycisphaerales bacterium]